MKFLIIQSDGEHKGQDGWTPNWYLRECYAIQHALVQNGQEADIWGLRHGNFEHLPDFESYDALFCIENYETSWLPDFQDIRKPIKLQWIIDLHCQDKSNYSKISSGMDIVLHSTKSLIDEYEEAHKGLSHVWFPNGVDDRYFYPRNIEKKIDIAFVGSKNPSRKEFIERLESDIGLKYFFATGQDMIDIVSSCKIHFNKNIGVDKNYRIFETIGLGTCLVTNYDDILDHMGFVDGENVILYNSYEEASRKIRQYLDNGKWESISNGGRELAKSHSYSNRISELLIQI